MQSTDISDFLQTSRNVCTIAKKKGQVNGHDGSIYGKRMSGQIMKVRYEVPTRNLMLNIVTSGVLAIGLGREFPGSPSKVRTPKNKFLKQIIVYWCSAFRLH